LVFVNFEQMNIRILLLYLLDGLLNLNSVACCLLLRAVAIFGLVRPLAAGALGAILGRRPHLVSIMTPLLQQDSSLPGCEGC